MSSAPIRREAASRTGSAVRRGARAAAPGVYGVRRSEQVGVPASPSVAGWIYDATTRCTFDMNDPGSVAAGASGVASVSSVGFTGSPSGYVDTSTFLTTGLYIMEGTIELTGTAGDLARVSFLIGDNQFDRFVPMTGATVEYTFAETGPAAVGESFLPWAVTNLGSHSLLAHPSGHGQLYPIFLV